MAKVKVDPKPIPCGVCGGQMVWAPVSGCWRCTNCPAETWHDGQTLSNSPPILVDKVIRETFAEDIRVGVGPPKKRGGSKSGRKRKKPPKKTDWAGSYYEV